MTRSRSRAAGRPGPGRSARGTRWYLTGAFVGALIVLALTLVTGWPMALSGSGPDPAAVAAAATARTCLTWSRPDVSDLRAVPCADPHLFEVTGTVDLSGSYPPGAAFPNQATWQHLAQQDCVAGATAYLGRLDPYGRYSVGALKPNAQQWGDRDRTLLCGLESVTSTGQLLPSSGTARGQDQSAVYPVGTCLALVGKAAGGPIDCGRAHAYEIVGVVDLHDQFPDGYPPVSQQQTALARLCAPLAAGYTDGLDLGAYHLTLTWDTVQQASWNAGSYRVNCKIGAQLPDGSGLGPVTNSVHDAGSANPPSTSGG